MTFAMTLQPPPVLASERRWTVSFVFASLTKWHHHHIIIIVFGGYANRICIQPKPSSSSSSSRERETRCDEYSATRCCCSCSLLPKLLPFFDAKKKRRDHREEWCIPKVFSFTGKETLNLMINPKP